MIADHWNKLSLLLLAAHAFAFSPSVWTPRQQRSELIRVQNIHRRQSTLVFSTPKKSQNLSASSQERRDEEKRRSQRKDDVVIGKTSAVRDATNYALNPKSTEEEWLRQASLVDRKVAELTAEGMESLKMLQLEEAGAAFDEVLRLKPEAYLWQAGIVKFYLNELDAAANLFAKNAAIYESKFGGRASEERIWRHACELKLASSSNNNNKKKATRISKEKIDAVRAKLTPIPDDMEEDPDSIFAETRKVVRIAGDLYESSVDNDTAGVILARAKLRSIGGNFDALQKLDLKQWKLQSWFFLGLHYDAMGEISESKECMKMALGLSPNSGNSDNILHVLPLIHMSERDWFDDDGVDVDPLHLLRLSHPDGEAQSEDFDETSSEGSNSQQFVDADPLLSDSIRKSINKMNVPELQRALMVRGIKSAGAKKQLQDRLFESLMTDTGLAP